MKRNSWVQITIAAIAVLVAGALAAIAGPVAVEIEESEGDSVVTIDADGVTETIRLDDLADGGERTVAAGDSEVTVRRVGDRLEVSLDGRPIHVHRAGDAATVWVGEDGGKIALDGDHEMVFITSDGDAAIAADGGGYVWTTGDGDVPKEIEVTIEQLKERLAGGEDGIRSERVMVMRSPEDGGHVQLGMPGRAGMVRYRCAETGSELLVRADDAVHDTYIDPATGCVLEKVAEPERRIITVVRERGGDDEPAE